MPRVKKAVARKNYPDYGIKKGDTYYSWKFRYGGLHRSKTPPRPSQLTQSEFLSAVYSVQESIEDLIAETNIPEEDVEDGEETDDADSKAAEIADSLASAIREFAEEIRNAGEECRSRRDNMPEHLQSASTGELLETRADRCEELANELETVADSVSADDLQGSLDRLAEISFDVE